MRISIVLVLLFFIAGCGSVKKLITHKTIKVDSVSVHSADSASKKEVTTSQKGVGLSDFDIDIIYSDSDTAKATEVFNRPEVQVLHDVVRSVSGNRVPVRVNIHIGSFTDSSKYTKTTDSIVSHSSDTASLKKTVQATIRDVQKSGLPWWVYVSGGVIGLVCLVVFGYRLYKKFFI